MTSMDVHPTEDTWRVLTQAFLFSVRVFFLLILGPRGKPPKEGGRETGGTKHRPDAIIDYNKNMRLVDKADMMTSYIDCTRKTKKWPTRVFQQMIRLCLLNSFVKFKEENPRYKKPLREYSYAVAEQWLQESRDQFANRLTACSREIRFTCRAFLESIIENGTKKYRRCHVCWTTSLRPIKRKEVNTRCKNCKVALCATP